MNRRGFLKKCGIGAILAISGCGNKDESGMNEGLYEQIKGLDEYLSGYYSRIESIDKLDPTLGFVKEVQKELRNYEPGDFRAVYPLDVITSINDVLDGFKDYERDIEVRNQQENSEMKLIYDNICLQWIDGLNKKIPEMYSQLEKCKK